MTLVLAIKTHQLLVVGGDSATLSRRSREVSFETIKVKMVDPELPLILATWDRATVNKKPVIEVLGGLLTTIDSAGQSVKSMARSLRDAVAIQVDPDVAGIEMPPAPSLSWVLFGPGEGKRGFVGEVVCFDDDGYTEWQVLEEVGIWSAGITDEPLTYLFDSDSEFLQLLTDAQVEPPQWWSGSSTKWSDLRAQFPWPEISPAEAERVVRQVLARAAPGAEGLPVGGPSTLAVYPRTYESA